MLERASSGTVVLEPLVGSLGLCVGGAGMRAQWMPLPVAVLL